MRCEKKMLMWCDYMLAMLTTNAHKWCASYHSSIYIIGGYTWVYKLFFFLKLLELEGSDGHMKLYIHTSGITRIPDL